MLIRQLVVIGSFGSGSLPFAGHFRIPPDCMSFDILFSHNGLRRPLFALFAVFALALAGGGCNGCGGEEEEETASETEPGAGSGLPREPSEITAFFAEALPANARSVAVLRGWDQLTETYRSFRPRLLRTVGSRDLGMIETDIRNTLGIDLTRERSLADIGVALPGGGAIAVVGETPISMVMLADSDLFVSHVTEIAQGQPFNLRAPVEESDHGRFRLFEFRRRPESEPTFSLAISTHMAIFIEGADPTPLMEVLAAVDADNSLASNDTFTSTFEEHDDYPVYVFLDAAGAMQDARGLAQTLGLPEVAMPYYDRMATAVNSVSAGIGLSEDALSGHLLIEIEDELRVPAEAMLAGGDPPPEFARMATSDAYIVGRGSLDGAELRSLVEAVEGDHGLGILAAFNDALEAIAATTEMDVEEDLFDAVGPNFLIAATRARILSIRRVMQSRTFNPGEAASAFGVIMAFEVRDRDTVQQAMEMVVTMLDGRAETFEDDGNLVLQFTDPSADIGNMVLTDDLLLVLPERERSDLIEQIESGDGNLEHLSEGAPRDLVTSAGQNGGYIDVRAILDGPLGTVAAPMIPDAVSDVLDNLGQIVGQVGLTDDGVEFDGTLYFAPMESGE